MTLNTQTTDRKAMAHALARELGVEARYLRAPTYAYRVGDYSVNRDGSITGADLEAIRPFLIANGYIQEEPEEAETQERTDGTTSAESEDIDLSIPAPDMTTAQLKNLFFTVYSKQYLLNRMMGEELITIPETLITRLQEVLPETLEDFTSLLDDLRASAGLRGFDYRDGVITMAVSHSAQEPSRCEAFAGLLGRMIKTARVATRVFPELQKPESEKYAVRNWLLRMGYSGPDLKAQRRELLKNLTGASAFQSAEKAQAHKDKYAELRRQEREARHIQLSDSGAQEAEE